MPNESIPEWPPEALEQALKTEPLTGAEIIKAGLIGGWEEKGIADGAEWVEEQRRKRRERRLSLGRGLVTK